jgi:hypothetical protein
MNNLVRNILLMSLALLLGLARAEAQFQAPAFLGTPQQRMQYMRSAGGVPYMPGVKYDVAVLVNCEVNQKGRIIRVEADYGYGPGYRRRAIAHMVKLEWVQPAMMNGRPASGKYIDTVFFDGEANGSGQAVFGTSQGGYFSSLRNDGLWRHHQVLGYVGFFEGFRVRMGYGYMPNKWLMLTSELTVFASKPLAIEGRGYLGYGDRRTIDFTGQRLMVGLRVYPVKDGPSGLFAEAMGGVGDYRIFATVDNYGYNSEQETVLITSAAGRVQLGYNLALGYLGDKQGILSLDVSYGVSVNPYVVRSRPQYVYTTPDQIIYGQLVNQTLPGLAITTPNINSSRYAENYYTKQGPGRRGLFQISMNVRF